MRRGVHRAIGLFLAGATVLFFAGSSRRGFGQPAPAPTQTTEIIVRVHDAETGAPIPNLPIDVGAPSVYHKTPAGQTDARGEFRFRPDRYPVSLELGNIYHHDAGPPSGAGTYPAPDFTFWKTFTGEQSESRVWNVKTYKNAFAYVPATFRGVVYDNAGKLAGGAIVRLLRDNLEQTVKTDAEGRFAFRTTRLRPGEERGAIVRAQSGKESALVYPTPEQTRSVIPIWLRPNQSSTVTGMVVDENGVPQAGVPARYFEFFPQSSAMVSVPARAGGVTDAAGRFTISGLTFEADYRFEFGGQTRNNPTSPWARTTLPAETNPIPSSLILGTRPIAIGPGQTRDLGQVVVLQASRTINGKIASQIGPLPPHLLVVVRGPHTNALAFPNANGEFSLGFIPHEPLSITVHQSDDGGAWDTSTNFVYAKRPIYEGDVTENQTEVQIILPEKKP